MFSSVSNASDNVGQTGWTPGGQAMAAGAVSLLQFAEFCPRVESPMPEAARAAVASPTSVRSQLDDAIEVDIGPRLVLLHHTLPTSAPERVPSEQQIDEFAKLAIGADGGAAAAYFEKVRAQYHPLATLLSFLLAPAAQRLGEMWRLDECSFFDVTVGVSRLQAFMARVASEETSFDHDFRRNAMLIALPGETHLFGLNMVAKLLESAGWSVVLEYGRPAAETARAIAREWVGVVGVTVSSVSRIEAAASTIGTIRRCSANRRIGIIVGGAAFKDNPELAAQVGADAVGVDAPNSVLLASQLLRRQYESE